MDVDSRLQEVPDAHSHVLRVVGEHWAYGLLVGEEGASGCWGQGARTEKFLFSGAWGERSGHTQAVCLLCIFSDGPVGWLQGVICFSDPAVISKVSRSCKLLNWAA